ncbi:unnamed protein product [Toxocara canis]|uniref:Uncharacterized protein n=1 Tax=Toxocara canis TaxID=6265 RepID=A0A183V760_TOXCA|nr:unnamed protein product [Toxocara canis]
MYTVNSAILLLLVHYGTLRYSAYSLSPTCHNPERDGAAGFAPLQELKEDEDDQVVGVGVGEGEWEEKG